MSSSDHMLPIKFIETIHGAPKIHVAFNTEPRQDLSILTCKFEGHLCANIAK